MTDTTAGEGVTAETVKAAFHHFMHDAEFPCSASAMREAINLALAAQPSAGARGEAVAWRCKMAADDEWELCFSDPRCDTSDFAQVQPLYATPAQPDTGDVAALREALPDAHAEAVSAFRSWYFDHAGKRIFYNNARKAVDTILAALSKPNAQGREG